MFATRVLQANANPYFNIHYRGVNIQVKNISMITTTMLTICDY
uniref:Uncharacterized protein n=1 Tax=Setaria italica TaxID=4555 RepID=K3Z215_SETIT